MFKFAFLTVFLMTGTASLAQQSEQIRTKVPRKNIDIFLSDCGQRNIPQATCICMVKRLAATREGDFFLDMMGTSQQLRGVSDKQKHQTMVQMLDRHGLKPSEAEKFVTRGEAVANAAAKECS